MVLVALEDLRRRAKGGVRHLPSQPAKSRVRLAECPLGPVGAVPHLHAGVVVGRLGLEHEGGHFLEAGA